MLAVIFPWLAIGVMKNNGVFQCVCILVLPRFGHGALVAIKPILNIPFQVNEKLVLVQNAVEQVLIVKQNTLGVGVKIVDASMSHVVPTPIIHVDE